MSSLTLTSRQKRRALRIQAAARRQRALHSRRRLLVPAPVRQPEYWRDLSIEIGGTLVSGLLIFTFARLFGYLDRPAGRSDLLRGVGVFAIMFAVGIALLRVRRIRANRTGASPRLPVRIVLHAIVAPWSVPILVVGVALTLGYF